MHIKDMILSKYFLADDYYELIIRDAEQRREDVLEGAYPHTIYTELGLATAGGDIEAAVIEAIEIENRIKRLQSKKEKTKKYLTEALSIIGTRKRILLFVYLRTGIVLTTPKEFHSVREEMIDVLETLKQKEDRLIKEEYLSNFCRTRGGGGGYYFAR